MVVVELAQSRRTHHHDCGELVVWTFDREIVPPPLLKGVVPMELWQRSCDRFQVQHEAITTRRATIARHHAVSSTLWMYPVVIFCCTVLLYCFTQRYEKRGKFVWLAWLATDLSVALWALVHWLVTRFYLTPAVLKLDDEWYTLAVVFQREYERYDVNVGVKRVPAIQPFFVEVLPDGLLSCGLVLEQEPHDDDEAHPDAVEEKMPAALEMAGVPVDKWAVTLQQCQALEVSQTRRLEMTFRSTLDHRRRYFFYLYVCFVTAPFIAWAFGFTANFCTVYFVSLMVYCTCVQTTLHFLVAEATVRGEFQKCHDDWRALARQNNTVYAMYNVVVTVQTRAVPFLFKAEDDAVITSVFQAGSITRAVGLLFRTGVAIMIECGKVAEGKSDHPAVDADFL
jgi:hypothetical protein